MQPFLDPLTDTDSSTMADTTTLIFETIHGSRAYQLDRPGSDTDIKGIIVGPPD